MKSRIIEVYLTVLFLVIFIALCIWDVMSVKHDFLIKEYLVITILSLACLFLLNLGFAIFEPKQRMVHVIMSLLIIITWEWFFPLSGTWKINNHRRWFAQKGMQLYQPMADKVMQNKAMLTAGYSCLDDLVGRPYVFGKTNDDGSVTIQFRGLNGNGRAGYMYYSNPANSYTNYIHLTNGWYEYWFVGP